MKHCYLILVAIQKQQLPGIYPGQVSDKIIYKNPFGISAVNVGILRIKSEKIQFLFVTICLETLKG